LDLKRIEVYIDGITHDGRGVGRIDGQVAFIAGAIPGEKVVVDHLVSRGRFLEGEAQEIIEASPDRVKPPCPYFGVCGGCQLQHVKYERQLELKERMFADAFRNNPLPGLTVGKIEASPQQWRYRNKVNLHTSGPDIGYYLEDSHQLMKIADCPIAPEKISEVLAWWSQNPFPDATSLTYRVNRRQDRLLLVESPGARRSLRNDAWTEKAVKGLGVKSASISDGSHKIAQTGLTGLVDQMLGLKYKLSPVSFAQVNSGVATLLYATVIQWVKEIKPESVIEAYCGIGVLSLLTAPLVKQVIGLEISAPAVGDAEDNARLNEIKNARFVIGPCEETLPPAIATSNGANLLIVDPPRAGLSRQVLEAIAQGKPDDVIYISCNPATLARDLKYLNQHGYQVDEIKLFDMFPQTAHVESAVLITRMV